MELYALTTETGYRDTFNYEIINRYYKKTIIVHILQYYNKREKYFCFLTYMIPCDEGSKSI